MNWHLSNPVDTLPKQHSSTVRMERSGYWTGKGQSLRDYVFLITILPLALISCTTDKPQNPSDELPPNPPPETAPENSSEAEPSDLFLNALPTERSTKISLPGTEHKNASPMHLGDVDGDGFGDIALLDSGSDILDPDRKGSDQSAGAIWVVYGNPNRTPELDVQSALSTGDAFVINGPTATSPTSTNSRWTGLNGAVQLGDINADGVDDFAVFDRFEHIWVIYGGKRESEPLSVDTLDTTQGFSITFRDTFDINLAAAGDWNGDGTNDLLIGTANTIIDEVTKLTTGVFVLYGVPGKRENVNLFELTADQGIRIGTRVADAKLGNNLTALNDFNGDGLDDIAFTAPGRGFSYQSIDPGRVFILFGTTTPPEDIINVDTLPATQALTLTQASGLPHIGAYLSAADINGDGLSDLLIAALSAPDQQDSVNYLIHGTASRRPSPVTLESEADENGQILQMAAGDFTAQLVNDLNGDGISDLVVRHSTRFSIESYVKNYYVSMVFTPDTGFSSVSDILTLLSTGNGYSIKTTAEHDGGAIIHDVTPALQLSGDGDIDGDGLGDLLLGYRYFLEPTRGVASLIYSQ